MTLKEIIDRNARWRGSSIAWKMNGRTLTHAQFRDRSHQLASALYKAGARSQDRIGLLSMNSLELAIGFGACETHGFIAATVNFRLAPPEMKYIIADSGTSVLIFEAEFAGHIDQIRFDLPDVRTFVCIGDAPDWAVDWNAFLATGDVSGAPLPPPRPEDIAHLIYTSGTTGRPKGCMLDHACECATALTMAGLMGADGEDSSLLMMPLFHIGAKAQAMAQHWVGGAVHLHRSFDAEAVLQTIHDERITISHLAPMLIQSLLDVPNLERFDTSSLRTVVYSAAPMSPTLLRRALTQFGPIFFQMYGQTEGVGTGLPKGAHKLDDDPVSQQRLTSVGFAFVGAEVAIHDDDNCALPPGEVGEICLRGPSMMRGYWNNSAASIAALAGGWLHTGDMGRLDEDGYLYLVDRKKDVIISGGENIYSREVEEALMTHSAVASVAVIGAPDDTWGECVCAVVVLKDGANASEDELIAHSRTQIAGYKRPRRVVFADALPALPSGKVNKVALRAAYASPS